MSRSIFYRVKTGPGAWQRSVVDETALPQNVTGLTNGTTYEFDLGAGVLVDVTPSAPAGLTRQAATQLVADATNSLTYSGTHTASTTGSNRLFVVIFQTMWNASAAPTGITASFGGQALTQIAVEPLLAGYPAVWAGYILDANIPTGSQTLTVTCAETGNDNTSYFGFINVLEYSGVDQATPIPTSVSAVNFGTSISDDITVANASSIVVAAAARKNQNDTATNLPWTTNNGSSLLNAHVGTPTYGFGDGSMTVAEHTPGATGALTMTLTPANTSGSNNNSIVVFEIKAA